MQIDYWYCFLVHHTVPYTSNNVADTPSYYISTFLTVSISLQPSSKYLLFVCVTKSRNVSSLLTPPNRVYIYEQHIGIGTESTEHNGTIRIINCPQHLQYIHIHDVLLVRLVCAWCTVVCLNSGTQALKHMIPA
jgi:hypothetical protein